MTKGTASSEEWVTTNEGAQLTGYTSDHVRGLALRGIVPARKFGRDWQLNRVALLEYSRKMKVLGDEKHNPWKEDLAAGGRGRSRDEKRTVQQCTQA